MFSLRLQGIALAARRGNQNPRKGFSRLPSSQLRQSVTPFAAFRSHAITRQAGRNFRTFCTSSGTNKSPEAGSVFNWMMARRMVLIANTACAIQLMQWYQTDVLYIRGLNVLAMILFVFFDFHKGVYVYVVWEVLYTALNTYQIHAILRERQDVELLESEQLLWDTTFDGFLTKRQMQALLSLAEEKEFAAGSVLAVAGDPQANRMFIVVRGHVIVSGNNKTELARTGPGRFVAEFHFIEDVYTQGLNDKDRREKVDLCVGEEGATLLEFRDGALKEFLDEKPEVSHAVEAIWMRHMVEKFKRSNEAVSYRGYVDVLRGILIAGTVGDAQLLYLKDYRNRMNIDDARHVAALAEVGYEEADLVVLARRTKSQMLSEVALSRP